MSLAAERVRRVALGVVVAVSTLCLLSSHAPSADRRLKPRPKPTDDVRSQLTFVQDAKCHITDPKKTLQSFNHQLDRLLAGHDTVVTILHIGDSHIQAGFLSGETMRLLQQAYGNAGRGWIAPYKLARVNEPTDYAITSSLIKEWTAGRCIQREPLCPWGPGGIGIETVSNALDFTLQISPVQGAGYDFDQVLMFRDRRAMPMLPVGEVCESVTTRWGQPHGDVAVDTFRLDHTVPSMRLHTAFRHELPDELQKQLRAPNRYYGFLLANGRPGVLYHAVGNNGAMFYNYTDRDFTDHLPLFAPSLVIISLGTNESYGRAFRADAFERQIDAFIRLVRKNLPEVAILLTTPAESFRSVRRKRRTTYLPNPNMATAAETIVRYARREGLACFDLFGATGGKNSSQHWLKGGYFGRDRVHFTADGYREQGKLLYKALIRQQLNQSNSSHGNR